MEKKQVGKVTHYYGKIGVAVVELSGALRAGDKIYIEGHEKQFEQRVDSMQIEHETIPEAKPGQSVGLKVVQPVKENDKVFKLAE
jgi:putative protease